MHLNLIRLFVFAACVLAGALAIRFCEGNRRGRRPLAAVITVIYLTALCYDTLFSRTELAEAAEIGAHSAGAGAAREESPLLLSPLRAAEHLCDASLRLPHRLFLQHPPVPPARVSCAVCLFGMEIPALRLCRGSLEPPHRIAPGLTPLTINREGFPADGSSTGRSRRSCTSSVSERTFLAQRKPLSRGAAEAVSGSGGNSKTMTMALCAGNPNGNPGRVLFLLTACGMIMRSQSGGGEKETLVRRRCTAPTRGRP